MKILGALMVALAISVFGFSLSFSLKKRVTLLRSAISYITAVSERMRISCDELPQILEGIKSEVFIENGVFCGVEGLAPRERGVLQSFSSQLGRSDIVSQQRAAETHIALLSEILASAEEAAAKYSRLYSSLGVLCGIFAAVLII